ncbi:MAG: DUF5615 family PIN-like protein [Armatimonadetes bacterium]|nr:DUF5615 family PIN-like protein [Armatimonadota bacterium]
MRSCPGRAAAAAGLRPGPRGEREARLDLDLVRIQDVGLIGAPDPAILEWAASEGRVVRTHDVNTMIHHAEERIASGGRLAGLLLLPQPFLMAQWLGPIKGPLNGLTRYVP